MTERDWEPAYARRTERMKASEIRERLKLLEQPGAPGASDARKEGLMSVQTDALVELVELFNARKAIDVPRFFTEDFRLEDPGAGVIRTGLDGAQRMMEAVRALAHDGHLEILDMFESGNRVAARWSYKSAGGSFAMMSIYEFNGERIQRDWGILARAPWVD
jgi:hypothetical protein